MIIVQMPLVLCNSYRKDQLGLYLLFYTLSVWSCLPVCNPEDSLEQIQICEMHFGGSM